MRELTYRPVTTDVARVYRLATEQGPGWANITIREWPGGGSIDVQSDYGNYAYSWTAIGPGTLRSFLLHLDFDYFMGKAHPSFLEFDGDGTKRELRRDLLEQRRRCEINGELARWAFDAIARADLYDENAYYELVQSHPMNEIHQWAGDAPSPVLSASGQSRAFWEFVWPHACAFWREELASEAVAA